MSNITIDGLSAIVSLSGVDEFPVWDVSDSLTKKATIIQLAALIASLVSAGTVTSASVVSANGFTGTVATANTTPAITLTCSITGMLKGNGTAISAASAGTDFVAPGGALGTPSSGTLTSCTGLPVSTGISGLAANMAAFLATPSSANMIAAMTDETGTGACVFANTPTLVTPVLGAATGTSVAVTGALSSSGTAGIGYATGAGGTITQGTSRTTTVILNKISGAITLFTAAGSATAASFTVTNSTVAATDTISLSVKSSTTNKYNAFVTAVGTGSFEITFQTTGGTTSDAPVFNFNVIKGVTA